MLLNGRHGELMTKDDFIREASTASEQDPLVISVRDLIRFWGARGRGALIVDEINSDLIAANLSTSPSFEYGSLDSEVEVYLAANDDVLEMTLEQAESEPAESSRSETLVVGKLPSSRSGLIAVTTSDSLQKAQTLMVRGDFSQLAVIEASGRPIGMVSWESIAKQVLRGGIPTLGACIDPAVVLGLDDDLLLSIPRIVRSGAVLVQDRSGVISGIITTADLSEEFQSMASPFLLMGECERQLRRIIDARFSLEELRAASRSRSNATFLGAASMTFGDYQYLLNDPANWSRLEWDLDMDVFFAWMNEVRLLRNDVAHFSADGIEEERLVRVKSLTDWLRSSR